MNKPINWDSSKLKAFTIQNQNKKMSHTEKKYLQITYLSKNFNTDLYRVPLWHKGSGFVIAVAQVQFLAWELWYAMGVAKKKKTSQNSIIRK